MLTYNIYRGTSAGGEDATPLATGIVTPSFNDTGLTNGQTYYYRVTAVDPEVTALTSAVTVDTPVAGFPLSVTLP